MHPNTFGTKDDNANQMELLIVPLERENCSKKSRIKWLQEQMRRNTRNSPTQNYWEYQAGSKKFKTIKTIFKYQKTQISRLLDYTHICISIYILHPYSCLLLIVAEWFYKQFQLFYTPKRATVSRWCAHTHHIHSVYVFMLTVMSSEEWGYHVAAVGNVIRL